MSVILRVLTTADVDLVRKWRNLDLSPWRTPHLITEEMQQDFYKSVVCNPKSSHRFWAVDEGSRLVGMVGLTNIQWENRLAELNLIMAPDMMRYADQAVDLLLDQAFGYVGLETICGECYTCSSMLPFWCALTHRYDAFVTNLPRRKYWQGHFRESLYFSISRDKYDNYALPKRVDEHQEGGGENG